MTAQEIKDFCKEQGLTYKDLAELIGMTEGGIQNAVKKDNISEQTAKAIELLKEIQALKEQLKDYENLKQILKKALL
ncbi:helix-turn-helix transcriptional regulator [uncultured Helicobacter sp.]|uniref:helix-turn-helix domain-containing protein n=1 Tax=uncultured Helicobacter sp. TaxID=175537 RepID=UPI00261CAA59|nr:helix-turn-helix transcriptional regulator [uncultured Helicobacter sp.]